MPYEPALTFLKNIGKKFHLQIITLTPGEIDAPSVDLGLRSFLGMEEHYDRMVGDMVLHCDERTIYRLTDEFYCCYIYLRLPDTPRHTVLIAGPYITFEMSHEQFTADVERLGIPPWLSHRVEEYYRNAPVLQDPSLLLQLFTAFGETLWNDFSITEVDRTAPLPETGVLPIPEENASQQLLMDMQIMQARYDSENELLRVVAGGQILRAERLLSGFIPTHFARRAADPVRDIKNYCIIGNTLMRKAAEQGGVHPVYLDEISSAFAKRIESLSAVDAGESIFSDMVRSYCRLVRKHTSQHYSPLVEKAVLFIDADLSQDLSLSTIAEHLSISAGYLSSVFRKETGKTVTEYVNEKRANHAAALLRGSSLQVQTVAQYCGIPDVNYFSKIFKRYHGITPKEYRRQAGR